MVTHQKQGPIIYCSLSWKGARNGALRNYRIHQELKLEGSNQDRFEMLSPSTRRIVSNSKCDSIANDGQINLSLFDDTSKDLSDLIEHLVIITYSVRFVRERFGAPNVRGVTDVVAAQYAKAYSSKFVHSHF